MVRRSPFPLFAAGAALLFASAAGAGFAAEPAVPPRKIDFNRDVRPILSDRCFHCHGPDEKHREAELRLDSAEGVRKATQLDAEGKSAFLHRITTADPDEAMPPPSSPGNGKPLTAAEVSTLKRWLAEGAPFAGHWAFIAPVRPALPAVKNPKWVRNPIDAFVLERLERENLKPSPEADRARLLRRASLDLTGLPPTVPETDAFLADPAPDAFERAVDRMLASPRYGERMAILWLDAARYADTHGYQKDNERQMWRWRDWVIDAFNRNMPYDQFTIEQLAGDLLPDATLEQKIATGFNRNHRITSEGGSIPEEFRVEYVVDRVETTTTVWLGLTFGCARCHDHKYDPLSQKEFFELFAFFNNIPENGVDGGKGNAVPQLSTPVPGMEGALAEAAAEVAKAEANLRVETPERKKLYETWLAETSTAIRDGALSEMWTVQKPSDLEATGKIELALQSDGTILRTNQIAPNSTYTIELRPGRRRITGLRLETFPAEDEEAEEAKDSGAVVATKPDAPKASQAKPGAKAAAPKVAAPAGQAKSNENFVLSRVEVAFKRPDMNEPEGVEIKSATADYSNSKWPIAAVLDSKPETGWAIHGATGPWRRKALFVLAEPIESDEETVVTVKLAQEAKERPNHLIRRFRLAVSSAAEPSLDGKGEFPAEVVEALKKNPEERTAAEAKSLRERFLKTAPQLAKERAAVEKATKRRDAVQKSATTSVMVMQESKPRQAFVLKRGQYDQPGEAVGPGVPAALGGFPADRAAEFPRNRLGLARWLVDPANPLTSRVAVNQAWQVHFGGGLVRTSEDFGSQGEWPSHPELLDWLAVEFRESGWDLKRLHRLIVTSAAYRQASHVSPALRERDPENRLLARGSRVRLSGDQIRDQALFAAGLLVEKQGGPSVKPYQPAGLWSQVAGINSDTVEYVPGHGADLYRRSMYTFWKRAVAPPGMVIFDAAGREACNVRSRQTNTPLQALVTLNDVQFVEAARVLAERMLTEGGKTDAERIDYGWRRLLVRSPSAEETAILRKALARHRERFARDPDAAAKLVKTGEAAPLAKLDPVEHAAWTVLVNTLFNLDEAVVKE